METKLDSWGFPISEEKKESDYFNFPIGDTKLRVLTQPVGVKQYFKDGKYVTVDEKYTGPEKVNTKGWAWCIIRGSEELKIVKFPYSIIKKVQELMVNDEYQFDGFPMPYDLTIKATGEGLERRYEVTASRKNTEVTEDEKALLDKKTPIKDILQKMKEKVAKTPIAYPEPEGEIPF
jgi:hypothetical protein